MTVPISPPSAPSAVPISPPISPHQPHQPLLEAAQIEPCNHPEAVPVSRLPPGLGLTPVLRGVVGAGGLEPPLLDSRRALSLALSRLYHLGYAPGTPVGQYYQPGVLIQQALKDHEALLNLIDSKTTPFVPV